MSNISYWFFLGTIYLIILAIQDIKNKMWVDDRFNYLMLGLTISLYSHIPKGFWYNIFIIVLIMALTYYLKYFKTIGEGDINALRWVFLGFGYINLMLLVQFILLFLAAYIIYVLFKLWIFRIKANTPLFPIIAFVFILFSWVFMLY